jgi:hypothetical protein
MSVLAVCLSVFGDDKKARLAVYLLATFSTLQWASAELVSLMLWSRRIHEAYYQIQSILLQCKHRSDFWNDKELHRKHCVNIPAMSIIHASINLIIDSLTYVLPLVLVWRSPIDATKKSNVTKRNFLYPSTNISKDSYLAFSLSAVSRSWLR